MFQKFRFIPDIKQMASHTDPDPAVMMMHPPRLLNYSDIYSRSFCRSKCLGEESRKCLLLPRWIPLSQIRWKCRIIWEFLAINIRRFPLHLTWHFEHLKND